MQEEGRVLNLTTQKYIKTTGMRYKTLIAEGYTVITTCNGDVITKDNHVLNPETGKMIMIGKGVYNNLLESGYNLVVSDGKLILTKDISNPRTPIKSVNNSKTPTKDAISHETPITVNKKRRESVTIPTLSQEFIYLIQVDRDVYKIGRTGDITRRLSEHRRNAKLFAIYLILAVGRSIQMEKELISQFRDRFICVNYKNSPTREYFTGDLDEMIECTLSVYQEEIMKLPISQFARTTESNTDDLIKRSKLSNIDDRKEERKEDQCIIL